MEFKTQKEFSYYNNGDIAKVNTLAFDEEKLSIAKTQRELAIYFNALALKMIGDIKTDGKAKPDDDNKVKTNEEKLIEYRLIGFNLFSYLEESKLNIVLKILLKTGSLYHQNENDLIKNDKIIDELDIIDIYIILGYYFLNFTAKQLI